MDAVFTLSYPELIVAETLASAFKKKDGYSISIPLSRQQKGYDLLLYSHKTSRTASIQVKASRSYIGEPAPKAKRARYNYYLWFKRFTIAQGASDFYILFGVYPKKNIADTSLNRSRSPKSWWHHQLLLFTDSEMNNFLNSLNRPFIDLGFNHGTGQIFLTRKQEDLDFSQYLLKNQIDTLDQFLRR